MVKKTVELAEKHGWFYTRQFENEANADMHSRTTAKEILEDFKGERLDYWVTGFGTGGTLKGVARVLAKERPETKIVVCEPDDAPMLSSGDRAGAECRMDLRRRVIPRGSRIRCRAGARTSSPSWPGDAVDSKVISQVLRIAECRSHEVQQGTGEEGRDLRRHHLGRNVCGALRVAAEAPKGSTILCMLPDTGERYLSTPLFADVSVDMTEEEVGDFPLHAGMHPGAAEANVATGRQFVWRNRRRQPDSSGGALCNVDATSSDQVVEPCELHLFHLLLRIAPSAASIRPSASGRT